MSDIILWADSRHCSPWVLSVWVALKEKGIPFQVQELDLESGQNRKGDYPRMTLTAKVPALTHGSVWIAESLAILEYLEEVFPKPAMFAATAEGRAQDRQVLSYLRTDFAELRRCMPFEGIFLERKTPALTEEARKQCRRLMDLVDWRLVTRGKEPLTIADHELAFMLRRPLAYGAPVTPEARAFAKAIWSRPSVASWVEQDRSRFAPAPKRARAEHRARRTRSRKAPKK